MGGGPPQSTLNGNSLIPKFSKPIRILDSFTQNSPSMHTYIYIYIWYLYDIHHWRIFRSSHRKLALMGLEPTTTELRSGALTDWANRSWVELALRANFVQLLQFHLFSQCSRFISVFAFVSHHICLKRSLAQVITLVAKWIDTYGIYHWRIFRSRFKKKRKKEVAIESWPEWDLNPEPLNFVQTL